MRRIVSVWLPHLPIERIQRSDPGAIGDNAPWALVGSEARGQVVTAVNARAQREGIRPGVALADARAILPALRSRPAEPARDRVLLESLARWGGRYGPARNTDGIDGLWIDVTGVAHLFAPLVPSAATADASPPPGAEAQAGAPERAEAALLNDLIKRLQSTGLTARAGLADTHGAAHALARFATQGMHIAIAGPGATRDALAALPVDALRLAPASTLLLRRLGLTRIGDLYGLPRAALERRFRDAEIAARVLARLDQALGLSAEPHRALSAPSALSVRRSYAEPLIASTSIETEMKALAAMLAERLEATGQGLRRLVLSLYRTDASVSTISAGTSRPCRESEHMIGLLSEKLASIDAGFGIDALVLDAVEAEYLDAVQTGLAATDAATGASKLIDRLSNRMGAQKVTKLDPYPSHSPERATASRQALLAPPRASCATPLPGHGASFPQAARPAFLLPRPEPIRVIAEIPEGAPARFSWRRLAHVVIRAEGPERIAREWWRSISRPQPVGTTVRDYYRIEDSAGGRYWVFRLGLYDEETEGEEQLQPGWFMHGVFA
jgi:protein ImuB